MTAIRTHAVDPRSRANGPGTRFVVWFQGCSLGCVGCFNPATHAASGAASDVATVVARLDAAVPCDGVTLSGGEPLEQPEAAIAVLDAARARGLSTMAFSGYTIDEIRTQPLGPDVLSRLDVLVDGRYDASRSLRRELRGSSNQVIHCLTARYTHAELAATPIAEIVIGRDGLVQLSGVDPLRRLR